MANAQVWLNLELGFRPLLDSESGNDRNCVAGWRALVNGSPDNEGSPCAETTVLVERAQPPTDS